jgi:hypothetical protein
MSKNPQSEHLDSGKKHAEIMSVSYPEFRLIKSIVLPLSRNKQRHNNITWLEWLNHYKQAAAD